MTLFLTVLHVMVCVVLVVVVLLQHGKGADIGAVFGGGASTTVFGSRGAGNFLTKLTTGSALLFMVTSLSLAYLANTSGGSGIFEDVPAASSGEAAPAPGAAPTAEPAPTGGFEEVVPGDTGASAPAAPEATAAADAGTDAEAAPGEPANPVEPAPAAPAESPAP